MCDFQSANATASLIIINSLGVTASVVPMLLFSSRVRAQLTFISQTGCDPTDVSRDCSSTAPFPFPAMYKACRHLSLGPGFGLAESWNSDQLSREKVERLYCAPQSKFISWGTLCSRICGRGREENCEGINRWLARRLPFTSAFSHNFIARHIVACFFPVY